MDEEDFKFFNEELRERRKFEVTRWSWSWKDEIIILWISKANADSSKYILFPFCLAVLIRNPQFSMITDLIDHYHHHRHHCHHRLPHDADAGLYDHLRGHDWSFGKEFGSNCCQSERGKDAAQGKKMKKKYALYLCKIYKHM